MMSKRKHKQSSTSTVEDNNSLLFWIVIGFILLFLLISPYYKGLFDGGQWTFEGPIYRAILWSTIALLITALYLFSRWQLKDHGDLLSLLIWLIPISYGISALNSASHHAALNSLYIHVMFTIFFTIGLYFTKSKLGLTFIVNAIVGSGYLYVWYGIANWFGNAHYQDAIYGGRLSNVFQYPNTYAAVLIGLLCSSLILMMNSKRRSIFFLHAFMIFPILLSFFLTSSRGGLMVLPIVMIIMFLLIPISKQISSVIVLSVSGLFTLTVLNRITNLSVNLKESFSQTNSLFGWAIVITIAIIITFVSFAIKRYIESWIVRVLPQKRVITFLIPACIAAITIIGFFAVLGSSIIQGWLPESIQSRLIGISGEESSLFSRNMYYLDALKIMKDYPIFGAGGGAWSNLYQAYQTYAYTSNQAHNFLLQYLLEVGWFGFIILLGLIVYLVFIFVTTMNSKNRDEKSYYERLVFLVIASSILFHSIIDFDMSYVYIGALAFLCLGGMSSLSVERLKKFGIKIDRFRKIVPMSLVVISIIMLFVSVRLYQANYKYEAALRESRTSGDYNKITSNLDQALKYYPGHPTYESTKINLLNQVYHQTKDEKYYSEALNRIDNLNRREPNDRVVLNETYLFYVSNGMFEQANQLFSHKLEDFPWDINLYEKMITIQSQWGFSLLKQGLDENAIIRWNDALSLYEEVVGKRSQIDNLSKIKRESGYMFKITPQIALSAGQSYYMKGDFKAAETTIKKGRNSNDFSIQINREVARWYLASLQKQGKKDDNLRNLLIAADNSESEKIQEILSMPS